MKNKVAVAISGGVDSAVAAALLKQSGYEVIGLTMRVGFAGAANIRDAKRVAAALGIRHYVFDLSKQMQQKVVNDFVKEYCCGRTPNPCIRCNELLKFSVLLQKALNLGSDYFATGHYCRVVRKGPSGGKYYLAKANDPKKDQSYFLYRLTQDKLRRIIFPLGDYTKEQVRVLAKKFKLAVAEKKDSQEICFIKGSYQDFLARKLKGKYSPGDIIDTQGNILGRHKGIPFYTIGQRDKLGVACGYPVYVCRIDARDNTISVAQKPYLMRKEFEVKDLVWPSGVLKQKQLLKVRIRYLSEESKALVVPKATQVKVYLKQPRFAVTPGQSAVFYSGDIVVGGGIIA